MRTRSLPGIGFWLAGLGLAGVGLSADRVQAQAAAEAVPDAVPPRPAILFNRWQEDWSVLADARVPREPLDDLKYIPLSAGDPADWLSLGANLRERFEANDTALFGTGGNRGADYVISRAELHGDLRLDPSIQAFAQLQSDFAPFKQKIAPVDRERLDLEQAFIAAVEPLGSGTLKLRAGRQQFGFDLQRFVSVRDGPNVRQSYDALWADYEHGKWRFIAFGSHPVQSRDDSAFDDSSSHRLTFSGARIERRLTAGTSVTAYYAHFTQQNARWLTGSGDERREVLDGHLVSKEGAVDVDVEAMGQFGSLGSQVVRAWAVGSMAGYTLGHAAWTPRMGLQVDAASGGRPGDHTMGTFNPLFPNGAYVTLAGYTGYVNFIQVKPSVTVWPLEPLKLMFAVAAQWRETTADAVYTQPTVPVPGTLGQPGQYTGTYEQLRLDWTLTPARSFAIEAVHFGVSDVIRNVGGRDSNYVGVQLAQGW